MYLILKRVKCKFFITCSAFNSQESSIHFNDNISTKYFPTDTEMYKFKSIKTVGPS